MSRSIVTAGHCVCLQVPKAQRPLYPKCEKNQDKKLPVNKIVPGRDIYYIVGQQMVDVRLRSVDKYGEVLYDLPKAQKAYTYEHKDTHKKDIGILIVDIASWENRVLHNIVRPIELPDKG